MRTSGLYTVLGIAGYVVMVATFLLLVLGAGFSRYEGPLDDRAWHPLNQSLLFVLGAGWLLALIRFAASKGRILAVASQLAVVLLVAPPVYDWYRTTAAGIQRPVGGGPSVPIMKDHPRRLRSSHWSRT